MTYNNRRKQQEKIERPEICPMFQEPHHADHGDGHSDGGHGDEDGDAHSDGGHGDDHGGDHSQGDHGNDHGGGHKRRRRGASKKSVSFTNIINTFEHIIFKFKW